MNRLNKVLLATDFSKASERALEHAAVIAAKNDAALQVLHVRVLLQGEHDETFPERDRYQEALNKAAQTRLSDLRPSFNVPLQTHSVSAVAAAPAIVEFAASQGVDLIVIGSHGRTGLRHALLGSVAQEVARRSPVSVLVVGAESKTPAGAYKTVVAPVDFSDLSKRAFHEAAALCQRHKARLVLMHVVATMPYPAYYMAAGDKILDMVPQLERHTQLELDKWISDADLAGVSVTRLVREGPVHKEIATVVEQENADLVVVGTAGLSGFDRLLLGSVAEKVLRTSKVPVLIVKSDEQANI